MKTSEDKNRLFLDMQQHPEKYSDEQIEALMNEIDAEPDATTAWEEFSANHPETKVQPAKRISIWYKAIAAMVVVLLGVWGIMALNDKADGTVASTKDINFLPSDSSARKNINDKINIARTNDIEDQSQEKSLAQATSIETDESSASPTNLNDIHIRGAVNKSSGNEPIYIVNGHRVQSISGIIPSHIAKIDVWKGDKMKAEFACYGEQAKKDGIIEITLKPEYDSIYNTMYWKPQKEAKVIKIVGGIPNYPGGNKALRAFITKNLQYPSKAEKSHAKGTILINFVVYKDGTHGNYKLLSSSLKDANGKAADPAVVKACVKEAIRVCKLMPRWTPGSIFGQKSDMEHKIGFTFGAQSERKIWVR